MSVLNASAGLKRRNNVASRRAVMPSRLRRPFRGLMMRNAFSDVHRELKKCKVIFSPDLYQNKELMSKIIREITRQSLISWRYMMYLYLIPGAIIMYILVMLLMSTETFREFRAFNLAHNDKFGMLALLVELVVIACIFTPLWLYSTLSTRNSFERIVFLQWRDLAKYTVTIVIILSLLVWGAHGVVGIAYSSEFVYDMMFGLTLLVWMSASFYAMFILGQYIIHNIQHRARLSQPVGVLVCALIDALYELKTNGEEWNLFDFKHRVMRHIETSAACCDSYFVERLATEDAGTNAWVKMQMGRAAAAIRAKKKFLLMSEDDGRDRLINGLQQTLVACAGGNWHGLEQQPAEASVSADRPWRHRMGRIVRGIIIGLLPAAVLVVWQSHTLPLPEIPTSAATFLTTTVVGWAVVSLLALFDPQSLEKAKTVTEISKKIQ